MNETGFYHTVSKCCHGVLHSLVRRSRNNYIPARRCVADTVDFFGLSYSIYLLGGLLVQLGVAGGSVELVADSVVLSGQIGGLRLKSSNVLILLLQLSLEQSDLLVGVVGGRQLGLDLGVGGTLELVDEVSGVDELNYQRVGSVQNERQEEGESAQVHVSLAVELSGLELGSFGGHQVALVFAGGSIDRDSVHSVDGVDEEDQNEHKSELEAQPQLVQNLQLGQRQEKLPSNLLGKRGHQQQEGGHLRHQNGENKSVVECHGQLVDSRVYSIECSGETEYI